LNRGIFSFNEVLDAALLKPVAQGYRAIMPTEGRKAVNNFLRNLNEPVNMANAMLQMDFQQTMTSLWRFLLNSTLGFGGLYDFAGENATLPYREEDFGQTLAVWAGNDDSSYFMIPILGPSTIRDAFGRIVDIAFNPLVYFESDVPAISQAVADGITTRERLLDVTDDIYRTSFDPYATIRSGYLQHRKAEIFNTRKADGKAN